MTPDTKLDQEVEELMALPARQFMRKVCPTSNPLLAYRFWHRRHSILLNAIRRKVRAEGHVTKNAFIYPEAHPETASYLYDNVSVIEEMKTGYDSTYVFTIHGGNYFVKVGYDSGGRTIIAYLEL